jgi:glutamate--cysteine ligase
MTFREFLKNGYNGYYATQEDWFLHLSLYFPDVRFKNYIEVRNHDNQNKENIMAVPAFWKGILYNNDAIDAVEKLLKKAKYIDYLSLREKIPQYALNTEFLGFSLCEIAREIFMISYDSLKTYGQQEQVFLENIMSLLKNGLTPADVVVSKWENEWNGDILKFIEYSTIN